MLAALTADNDRDTDPCSSFTSSKLLTQQKYNFTFTSLYSLHQACPKSDLGAKCGHCSFFYWSTADVIKSKHFFGDDLVKKN